MRALQLANAVVAPYDTFLRRTAASRTHSCLVTTSLANASAALATGECLYTRFEFLNLVAAQGADIIQPDICVCGGLLEMRKIAAMTEAHYVSIAPHNPMGPLATAVNVHFAAAAPNQNSRIHLAHRNRMQ